MRRLEEFRNDLDERKQKALERREAPEKNVNLTGARMKIPTKGILASRRPLTSSGASKDSTCACV